MISLPGWEGGYLQLKRILSDLLRTSPRMLGRDDAEGVAKKESSLLTDRLFHVLFENSATESLPDWINASPRITCARKTYARDSSPDSDQIPETEG